MLPLNILFFIYTSIQPSCTIRKLVLQYPHRFLNDRGRKNIEYGKVFQIKREEYFSQN